MVSWRGIAGFVRECISVGDNGSLPQVFSAVPIVVDVEGSSRVSVLRRGCCEAGAPGRVMVGSYPPRIQVLQAPVSAGLQDQQECDTRAIVTNNEYVILSSYK